MAPTYGSLITEFKWWNSRCAERREMIMAERKRKGLVVCSLLKPLPWRDLRHEAMFHQPKQGENSLESCVEGIHVGRKEGRVRGNQKHN